MSKPLMSRATAVWLVENTTLTFRQIAEFCGMHELEVQGIADGDVSTGVKGFDPVSNNQLEAIELARGQADPLYKLKLKFNASAVGEEKRRGPRYTPLSKRQDRPAAILWLVKFHPELSDGVIGKLVGTTKPTIQSIRERSHWNISNIQPIDPVARFHLGNGARVERIHWGADPSAKGSKQSFGLMVNYLYDLKRLDKHRAQLAEGKIPIAGAIEALYL